MGVKLYWTTTMPTALCIFVRQIAKPVKPLILGFHISYWSSWVSQLLDSAPRVRCCLLLTFCPRLSLLWYQYPLFSVYYTRAKGRRLPSCMYLLHILGQPTTQSVCIDAHGLFQPGLWWFWRALQQSWSLDVYKPFLPLNQCLGPPALMLWIERPFLSSVYWNCALCWSIHAAQSEAFSLSMGLAQTYQLVTDIMILPLCLGLYSSAQM